MFELGPIVSYSKLMNMVTELELAEKYIPNFTKVNKSFRLRPTKEDTKPSCRVFSRQNKLYIKDFGDSQVESARTIFQFIVDEHTLSKTTNEAIDMIVKDFNLNINKPLLFKNRSKLKDNYIDKETIIAVKYRTWNKDDINYWGGYGVSIELLESSGVHPISYFWIDSNKVDNRMFKAEKLSYTYDYYVKDGVFRRKIYQPKSKWLKWLSNCSLDVVQNYRRLPKSGELLIIQSSLKDALVMNTFGYDSIAPISESTWFTDIYWDKIVERFDKIIYFSNNDWSKQENNGVIYGEKISKEHNIPVILIENQYKCSDISDFRQKYGQEKTKEILKLLINI